MCFSLVASSMNGGEKRDDWKTGERPNKGSDVGIVITRNKSNKGREK